MESCVDAYGSIYATSEYEVLKLEHIYPDHNFTDCLYVTNHEAFASSFLDADIAENGLLADTLGEPIEGLADVGDNFRDICEDDLLDIIKDETSVPHMVKNDTRGDEKEMVLKTPDLDPMARIFRFKTKPRAKKLKMWNQDDDNGETKARTDKIRSKHRWWSLPEVLKLVQGVSKCGVGKWVEMKELFFEESPRSSVDLKDKWRNLVAMSCRSSSPGKGRGGRALIPEDILRQVRELSEIHSHRIPRSQRQRMKEFKTESSSSSNSKDSIWSPTSEDNISSPTSEDNIWSCISEGTIWAVSDC